MVIRCGAQSMRPEVSVDKVVDNNGRNKDIGRVDRLHFVQQHRYEVLREAVHEWVKAKPQGRSVETKLCPSCDRQRLMHHRRVEGRQLRDLPRSTCAVTTDPWLFNSKLLNTRLFNLRIRERGMERLVLSPTAKQADISSNWFLL